MCEEAASLASSIIENLLRENCRNESVGDDIRKSELGDMLESAGMVFVQSTKEIAR